MTFPVTVPAEMHEAMGTIERIGGHALVEKIKGMFESPARERFVRLDALVAAGDTHQVSRVAHAIKGSAAQVGASGLRELAGALEKDAGTLDQAGLVEAVTKLQSAFEVSLEQLATIGSPGAAS